LASVFAIQVASISGFMKMFNEYIGNRANKEEKSLIKFLNRVLNAKRF